MGLTHGPMVLYLVLRNPIDRVYSQYKMTVKDVYTLRQYSLEDMVFHLLKAMKDQFNIVATIRNFSTLQRS